MNTRENTNPEAAMTAGNERSISPQTITRVSPRAKIAVKGIVDMYAE
jgi:hypothetical protein